MDCYLHNVTTVEKAHSSNSKYFNCVVQSDKQPVRAVCYSPEKRAQMKAFEITKSPVKILNFKETKDDLIITKWTSITPPEKEKISFAYSDKLSASSNGQPVVLSAVHNLAAEQLIAVKGETTSISGVKSATTMFSGKTEKQDVIIRDTTAYMKLVLWGKYVNTLELNNTYLFKNVRVKAAQSGHYLNTPPPSDAFVTTECEKFTGPLVEVEKDVNTTSRISAQILGVQRSSKSLCCVSCNKTVDVLENKAVCKSCSLTQLPIQCHVVWPVQLLVK